MMEERIVGAPDVVGAILGGLVFVVVMGLLREPTRRRFNAIFVAGAGAAYLGSGLGLWEFVYTAIATLAAFKGLDSWRFIGVAWTLHVGWDVMHHLYGDPIIVLAPTSSFGCAVCDSVIALWCFAGGPALWNRGHAPQSQG